MNFLAYLQKVKLYNGVNMQNELKELEEITKEYLSKINVLIEKIHEKIKQKERVIYDVKKTYNNIDYISIMQDFDNAKYKVYEILADLGKFNTIKKYNFTQQELRILLFFDYFNDLGNITDMLRLELKISKRTLENHFINIANKIKDILMPYINNGEIDIIEINENNNAVKPKYVIKHFLSELWHYLK